MNGSGNTFMSPATSASHFSATISRYHRISIRHCIDGMIQTIIPFLLSISLCPKYRIPLPPSSFNDFHKSFFTVDPVLQNIGAGCQTFADRVWWVYFLKGAVAWNHYLFAGKVERIILQINKCIRIGWIKTLSETGTGYTLRFRGKRRLLHTWKSVGNPEMPITCRCRNGPHLFAFEFDSTWI